MLVRSKMRTEEKRMASPSHSSSLISSWHLLSLLLLVFAALVHGQSGGFISIDCGKPKGTSYVDVVTGLTYTSDEGYIDFDVGEIHHISSDYEEVLNYSHSSDLRSFPNSNRNCYTLGRLFRGKNYIFRALFLYGNYDGLNRLPKFDIYLGIDLWQTIEISDASVYYYAEIIAVASGDTMLLCLADTGTGTPFVSAIDVRPVSDRYVSGINNTLSAVTVYRLDLGATYRSPLRYKNDTNDRLWTAYTQPGWTTVSASSPFDSSGAYDLPQPVMSTAVVPANNFSLNINLTTSIPSLPLRFYLLLHFAEIQSVANTQSRIMDIFVNNEDWNSNTTIKYLSSFSIYGSSTSTFNGLNITILKANDSVLPPIINALEFYMVRQLTGIPTTSTDVDAIVQIKKSYMVNKNWMGDPCVPNAFVWDGLNCTYGSSGPRITSLNLSSNGLTGQISPSIANLSQLQYLDLSNNNLTGGIPEFLGNLQFLKYLNLKGNKLNTSVPKELADRSASGTLLLGIDDDQIINNRSVPTTETKKKYNLSLVLAVSICSSAVLLAALLVAAWRFKICCFAFKRRKHEYHNQIHTSAPGNLLNLPSFSLENKKFAYQELVLITDNFKELLGSGAFGKVFYGELSNGIPVAVKMLLQLSHDGRKQFQSEAQLLTRIHHKNLVSLIGYCCEMDHMALVYEFMAEGTIADHLQGEASKRKTLVWKERLRMSVEAAQGLQYLHDGCTPGVVHRDVKTSNILLGKTMEVKLGDFGLSRNFQSDCSTQFHTDVAGTPGYLDPEYLEIGKVNEKSDVYSFGIVLLELITGQPALSRATGFRLVQWVKPKINTGDLNAMIDPKLKDYNPNAVWKVIEIAMACIAPSSIERPSMMQVLMSLKECLALENFGIGFNQLAAAEKSVNLPSGVFPDHTDSMLQPMAR